MATMGLDIGGAETHIVELSKQLQARGHKVVVISNGGVYVNALTAAGIVHYQAPLHRRHLSDMLRALKLLRHVIATEKPDVVHAHARIPAFLCGCLQRSMKFCFLTSCHGVYQLSGPLRLLSNWGQRTLAVSEDIRDYLISEYHLPPTQIVTTINGIDTDKFSPEVSGAAIRAEFALGDAPVIVHVSRLDYETQLAAQQLIALAPALSQQIPNLRILIVGAGTAYPALMEQAKKINAHLPAPCLILTGARTDINALVAAGDLFVGVSRAALEAMAAGKCVILSGAQGHTGLFTDSLLSRAMDTNFCCRTDPVATEQRLRGDILAALALPQSEKDAMGAFNRSVVKKYYSLARMCDDCERVYRQLTKRQYKLVISGYYGFSNAGDDAILQAISQAISSTQENISLTVLSNNPPQTRTHYGLQAVHRFHLFGVLRALSRCDALLSGGGSLLQDTTSTRSLLYYLCVIRSAYRLKKPVMLYANGIGPVHRESNRKRVKEVVEKASLITLRDENSAKQLREMGVSRADIRVTADPVFHLSPAPSDAVTALFAKANMPCGAPFVAVSVRDWPNTEKFDTELARLCDHLQQKHGLHILFLLMQPARDRAMTERVRGQMTQSSYLLDATCSPCQLMTMLGQAKLCLSMRLHTLIFAARMAVPSLGLVYDPKVASFLEELGLPSAGNVSDFHAPHAIALADKLLEEYDKVLKRLQEKSTHLTALAQENEQLLLQMLAEHCT